MRSPEFANTMVLEKSPSIERAHGFVAKYKEAHPERAAEEKTSEVLYDLGTGRFWSVMAAIDGENDEAYISADRLTYLDMEDIARHRREKRTWAISNFSRYELDEIFDIYLDQALNSPLGTNLMAPGIYRGHRIAYDQLVAKGDSMFSDKITPDLTKKLNNGRFWEELSNTQISNGGRPLNAVIDVLSKNYEDLDLEYAPEGIKIYERNLEALNGETDLFFLNDGDIDRYVEFVKEIDQNKERLGLTENQIEKLVAPYIKVILETDRIDHESLRFEHLWGSEKEDFVKPKRDYQERIKEPIVQKYVTKETGTKVLAERLIEVVELGKHGVAEHVLASIPNKEEVLREMKNRKKVLERV